MKFLINFINIFFLLSFLHFSCIGQNTSTSFIGEQAIIHALEANNWSLVYKLTKEANEQEIFNCESPSVVRFLNGHAALAIGKNVEAMNQFYCQGDSTNSIALNNWKNWTKGVITNDSTKENNSNLFYLYGDALARKQEYFLAHEAFNMAVELNPNNFLAFNARGVNRWIVVKLVGNKDCRTCEDDWKKSLKKNKNFADPLVNRGVAELITGGDQMKCRKDFFEKAIELNPNHALAYNGIKVSYHIEGGGKGNAGVQYFKFSKQYQDQLNLTPFGKLDYIVSDIDSVLEARGFNLATGGKYDLAKDLVMSGVDLFKASWNLGRNLDHTYTDYTKTVGGFNNLNVTNLNQAALNVVKQCVPVIERGGVFFISDENNSSMSTDDFPPFSGTWFLLNYPSIKFEIEKN